MGHESLVEQVRRQADVLPQMYGRFASDAIPRRLALSPNDPNELDAAGSTSAAADRAAILADTELVDLMVTATRLGDVVADAYALLVPTYGMKQLISMLRTACRDGVDAVPDAPVELKEFIASMEATPAWIDMDLVREGARWERIEAAFVTPYVIRGAFLATFLNEYAALPMALTGTLSGRTSARRVKETASFFGATVLPGGTERHGPGFEAAAMVRLMHSSVRVHALRTEKWDVAKFGLPIPQVDQMPAGMINIALTSLAALKQGRTEFNEREQANAELARYRCFLLGLPDELLPRTPGEVLRFLQARAATLRSGFDDATCGELVRSTLAATLHPDAGRFGALAETMERSFSTVTFVKAFLGDDYAWAARMGVRVSAADQVRARVMLPWVIGRTLVVRTLSRVPGVERVMDRYVVATLERRLRGYGHPEYTARV